MIGSGRQPWRHVPVGVRSGQARIIVSSSTDFTWRNRVGTAGSSNPLSDPLKTYAKPLPVTSHIFVDRPFTDNLLPYTLLKCPARIGAEGFQEDAILGGFLQGPGDVGIFGVPFQINEKDILPRRLP